MDVFSPEKRSEVMSKIRSSRNRSTEERLATIFRRHGISGWRRNWNVFGKPDFVFPCQHIAIFVDGCFWHSCPKPGHCKTPATRTEWWAAKLERTKQRDRKVTKELCFQGWIVIRIWEHALDAPERVLGRLRKMLANVNKGHR
jgi:DNA mismatch endonuclease, patch repair protein